jgi:hypothetical protein
MTEFFFAFVVTNPYIHYTVVMKSEVYSWRVSSATKDALEAEARREGISIAALLDRITKEWVDSRQGRSAAGNDQARLHSAVLRTIRTIAGKNPGRSEEARMLVRQRLQRRHGS